MKKFVLTVLLVALIAAAAFAGGVSVWNESMQLYSAATETTAAVTASTSVFQSPVKDLGCDIATSPTTSVIVRIDGKSTYGGFDTNGLATATTCTYANCYFAITGKPVAAIRAVITSSTNTNSVVKVTCTGMQ